MNGLAARRRHEQLRRERATVAMRRSVAAVAVAQGPLAGSAAIADAVDEASAQLVAPDKHLWILDAKRRLFDEQQSAASRRRPAVAIDDLAQALTLSASGDLATSTEDNRTAWRVYELLSRPRTGHAGRPRSLSARVALQMPSMPSSRAQTETSGGRAAGRSCDTAWGNHDLCRDVSPSTPP
jgi:hypothetical protein